LTKRGWSLCPRNVCIQAFFNHELQTIPPTDRANANIPSLKAFNILLVRLGATATIESEILEIIEQELRRRYEIGLFCGELSSADPSQLSKLSSTVSTLDTGDFISF